jgi:hypothetical protein
MWGRQRKSFLLSRDFLLIFDVSGELDNLERAIGFPWDIGREQRDQTGQPQIVRFARRKNLAATRSLRQIPKPS